MNTDTVNSKTSRGSITSTDDHDSARAIASDLSCWPKSFYTTCGDTRQKGAPTHAATATPATTAILRRLVRSLPNLQPTHSLSSEFLAAVINGVSLADPHQQFTDQNSQERADNIAPDPNQQSGDDQLGPAFGNRHRHCRWGPAQCGADAE